MAQVRLTGVKKEFKGGVQALKGVDLHIREGEFFVLVGPSGCGKTTILRLIAGVDRPTQGDVLFDETSVVEKKAHERNTAMVFQSFVLYPHMNVYKNIAYPLRNKKVPKDEIDRRVRSVAEMFGITDLLNRRPRVLSGGQKQRVAIARAMVREPDIFLFDEPFSNLDVELRDELREQIRKIHEKTKTTCVYVTHDQVEAMALADRMAVMEGGMIHQIGTPREIYEKPEDLFTARFIGAPQINLIPARAERGFVRIGDHRIGISCNETGAVMIGIRPEAFVAGEKYAEDTAYEPMHAVLVDEARAGMGRAYMVMLEGMRPGDPPCSVTDHKNNLFQNQDSMVLFVKKDSIHVFGEDGCRLDRKC